MTAGLFPGPPDTLVERHWALCSFLRRKEAESKIKGRESHRGRRGQGTLGVLGLSWFPNTVWLPDGFQLGCLSRHTPLPSLSHDNTPAFPQASPPKVFRWEHPPTQVHPLLELVH